MDPHHSGKKIYRLVVWKDIGDLSQEREFPEKEKRGIIISCNL